MCLFCTLVISLGSNTIFFLTGYVLATLPSEAVKRATNSQYILEAIGQLSLPELLVVAKEIKPYNYAQLLLEKHMHPHQSATEIKSYELASFGHLI